MLNPQAQNLVNKSYLSPFTLAL